MKLYKLVVPLLILIVFLVQDFIAIPPVAGDTESEPFEPDWVGFGSPYMGRVNSIFVDSQDVFVAGEEYLLKFDKYGTLHWNSTWDRLDHDDMESIYVKNDAIYVTGVLNWHGSSSDIYLLKYDTNGLLIWNRSLDLNDWDGANSIFVSEKAIYIVGHTRMSGEDSDTLILKYDLNGALLWNVTWGGVEGDTAFSLFVNNEDIYVVGETYSYGAGDRDAFILKLDKDGKELWNNTWGFSYTDYALSVGGDYDSVYITGLTHMNNYLYTDVFLLKFDFNGNLLWDRTWGGNESEFGTSIFISGEEITLGGWTKSYGAGSQDVLLLRYDINGNHIWSKTWGGPDYEWAGPVYVDDDDIYIGGSSSGLHDSIVLKYNESTTLPVNHAPVAHFQVTPTYGNTDSIFMVDANTSTYLYPNETSVILQYKWDWEDDNIYDTPFSLNITNSHRYSNPGTYTIRLNVTDSNGASSCYTVEITVHPKDSGSDSASQPKNDIQLLPFLLGLIICVLVIIAILFHHRMRSSR